MEEQVEFAMQEIVRAIGSLPIEDPSGGGQKKEEEKKEEKIIKKRVKTVVLKDGTYGQEIVDEEDLGVFL